MRIWRSHPALFTAAIGAAIGLSNAVILMITSPHVMLSSGYLLALWPTSILGFGFNGSNFIYAIFLGIVEVGGNAALYACALSAPIGLVVAIRRSFGKPEKPISIARD
jgi:hypothetical protein